MRPEELLTPTPSGVCCQTGGFHIDPTRSVDKAVITHAHSDHARPGHGAVLVHGRNAREMFADVRQNEPDRSRALGTWIDDEIGNGTSTNDLSKSDAERVSRFPLD
jgi:putative mRNA 3-end processing factor